MKKYLKIVVQSLFYILTLPFGGSARLFYLIFGSSFFFNLFAQSFSLLPGLPGSYLRTCFYHQTLKESHLDVDYLFGAVVTQIMASIGHRVVVAAHANVGYVEIGDDSAIGNHVSILSGRHHHNFDDPSKPVMAGDGVFSIIQIGSNSFVGEKACVMANVGSNTIIGAGAVVVKDIPDYVVAVGNPAKVVKQRPRPKTVHPGEPERH